MKKNVLLIIILIAAAPLYSSSDGAYMLRIGISNNHESENSLNLFKSDMTIEKTWFPNNGLLGVSNMFSISYPLFYTIGNQASPFLDSFNFATVLDYSLRFAARREVLSTSLGPYVCLEAVFSKEKTIIANFLIGISQAIGIDIPINDSIGFCASVEIGMEFIKTDFTRFGKTFFISPRLDAAIGFGVSLYYSNTMVMHKP